MVCNRKSFLTIVITMKRLKRFPAATATVVTLTVATLTTLTLVTLSDAAEDVCRLAKDAGRCRATKPMFYFNMETKRCEGFIYKGCAGNGNRFEALEECHDACQQHLVRQFATLPP